MWKRWIKRMLLVGVSLVIAIGGLFWWAHRQTKVVPEFYERAIAAPPAEQIAQSSEQLQANVQQLQDDAAKTGSWNAQFSVEQINAWLIDQLPKRFPSLQAKGLQDPRVMIDDSVLTAAARFKDHRLDAVLSCELSVKLTDQPNRLAISVQSLRAGALPLPVSQFKDRIQKLAERLNLSITWDTRDGETVALLDLPGDYPGKLNKSVVIEEIQLDEQLLRLSGKTGEINVATFEPQGPIYKIALLKEESESDVVLPIGDAMP